MLNEIIRLAKVDAREGDAMHALMHCENEQACERCNPHNGYADAEQAAHYAPNEPTYEQTPANIQTDGPRSCERYRQSCECVKCEARDRWYITEAT